MLRLPANPFPVMRFLELIGSGGQVLPDPPDYADSEWVAAERKFEGTPIEDNEQQGGWAWWELKDVNPPIAELDALRLVAVFWRTGHVRTDEGQRRAVGGDTRVKRSRHVHGVGADASLCPARNVGVQEMGRLTGGPFTTLGEPYYRPRPKRLRLRTRPRSPVPSSSSDVGSGTALPLNDA
jgi:hypothetical protein